MRSETKRNKLAHTQIHAHSTKRAQARVQPPKIELDFF